MSERPERIYQFDDPGAGIKASHPQPICAHMMRYIVAYTWAVDMPDEKRLRYLDYGCGSGMGVEFVSTAFQRSYGVDVDDGALAYARAWHGRNPNLIYSKTIEGGGYDLITCIEMIEHIPVELADRLMGRFSASLARDGMLYLTTPIALTKDGVNPQNPWHVHEYQPGELGQMLEQYFKKVEIGPEGRTMGARAWEPRLSLASTSPSFPPRNGGPQDAPSRPRLLP